MSGYTLTKPKTDDDARDSDADPESGCTRQVTVGPGTRELLTLDAGFVPPVTPAKHQPGDDLANTGTNLVWWLPLGLLALALGTVTVLATRRRSNSGN
jgi:LPXTG-motif cell wall-anchored protein